MAVRALDELGAAYEIVIPPRGGHRRIPKSFHRQDTHLGGQIVSASVSPYQRLKPSKVLRQFPIKITVRHPVTPWLKTLNAGVHFVSSITFVAYKMFGPVMLM
jgi:hypothetical protein